MRTKHLIIALLVALLPTLIYTPELIKAATAQPVMVNIKKITSVTEPSSRGSGWTRFTLEASYPCATKAGGCACTRYWLSGSNRVGGDGADLLLTLRALEGREVGAWVSAAFGDEHCWFESNFSGHRGYSLVFGLIALAYLFLRLRAKK